MQIRKFLVIGTGILPMLFCSCDRDEESYIATSFPAAVIVSEITGFPVKSILDAGVSPELYEPGPSDAMIASSAEVFFYLSSHLDGWALSLGGRHPIELFSLVPPQNRLAMAEYEHAEAHEGFDPHFWLDPVTVASMLSPLVEELCDLNSEQCSEYQKNAADFEQRLVALDLRLTEKLAAVEGSAVILLHPAMQYFLERYGIHTVGIIEKFPGREPTAGDITRLVNQAKRFAVEENRQNSIFESTRSDQQAESNQRSGSGRLLGIFSEPQLSDRSVHIVAEAAGLPVFEFDPFGGDPGRDSYESLLHYNADVLLQAFEADDS